MNVYLTADSEGKVSSYIQAENMEEALDKNQLYDDVVCEVTEEVFNDLLTIFRKKK